jgi:hypothetical protein
MPGWERPHPPLPTKITVTVAQASKRPPERDGHMRVVVERRERTKASIVKAVRILGGGRRRADNTGGGGSTAFSDGPGQIAPPPDQTAPFSSPPAPSLLFPRYFYFRIDPLSFRLPPLLFHPGPFLFVLPVLPASDLHTPPLTPPQDTRLTFCPPPPTKALLSRKLPLPIRSPPHRISSRHLRRP